MSPPSTSTPAARALRERLEQAQHRVKELRSSLAAQDRATPLDLDLTEVETLRREVTSLEAKVGEATRQRDLARQARAGAEKLVLRGERPPPVGLLPIMLGLGLVVGGALALWWFGSALPGRWSRLGAGLTFGVSGAWLLWVAWRAGRVSGAREL